MKFRKKPVVIEAWPVDDLLRDAAKNWKGLPEPIRAAYDAPESCVVFAHDGIFIRTLEGEMRADRGDMVIRGVKGEFYPCKPDIFAATYEPMHGPLEGAGMSQKYLEASAEISDDGLYRYWLSRRLSMGERTVLFVGLNPSTADAAQDDPTIRRCVGFARAWGFDWLLMGNIYAYRSTDPKALFTVDDPVGPANQDALKWMTQRAELIIAAWGGNRLNCYGNTLAGWIKSLDRTRCLGQNNDGTPKHPLYLPKTTQPDYMKTGVLR